MDRTPFDERNLKDRYRIADGSTAEIYRASASGQQVAVKYFKKDDVSRSLVQSITTLRGYQHSNVVRMLSVSNRGSLVMELCERGNLQKVLHEEKRKLPHGLKLKLLTDVARGLNYLHSLQPPCIHRNIRSQNVYLSSSSGSLVAKIGDYASFRRSETTSYISSTMAAYRAPELLRSPNVSPKVDVYSFGLLLWEVMAEKIPYEDEQRTLKRDPFQLMMHVVDGNRPEISEKDCPLPGIVALIRRCWSTDPDERPDMAAVLATLKEMLASEERQNFTPGGFICPLTLSVMEEPVLTAPAGISYERSAIVELIKKEGRDPLTGKTLKEHHLIPNPCLKNVIETYAVQEERILELKLKTSFEARIKEEGIVKEEKDDEEAPQKKRQRQQ